MLRAADFTHFLAEISPAFVEKLNNLYRDPNDVDLFPAMLVEKPLPGGIVGPTLSCLLGQQFNNLRQCDRYNLEILALTSIMLGPIKFCYNLTLTL